jgi:hypothetical protein
MRFTMETMHLWGVALIGVGVVLSSLFGLHWAWALTAPGAILVLVWFVFVFLGNHQ